MDGWPGFEWDRAALRPFEARLLHQAGVLYGALQHLEPEEQGELRVRIFGEEAVRTSAIEGEMLDRESVQSSIRQQLGLSTTGSAAGAQERGVAELFTHLYQHWDQPLTKETLFDWHRMLMQGQREIEEIGCYRSHPEAMQIVSGPIGRRIVHYEAPPSRRVAAEMDGLLRWANADAVTEAGSALAASGIGHLRFVAIHPFEDGNGRLARALSEKMLARALGRPTLAAISTIIEARRDAYYTQLQRTNRSLQVTEWLTWFAEVVVDAIDHSHRNVRFLISKARLFERLRGKLNPRQEKALLRMFREGLDGFKGGLSADNYIRITQAARATATRDLRDLVDKRALTRTGERKHTRYFLKLNS